MLVDTNELFKCETCRNHKYYGCNTFCDTGESYSPDISKLTAVDAVEVVRCGDCKHYDCGICELHSEKPSQYSAGLDIEMFADDFCSYGERKENETD